MSLLRVCEYCAFHQVTHCLDLVHGPACRELHVLHSRVGSGVEKGEGRISPQGERGISWGEVLHLCAA